MNTTSRAALLVLALGLTGAAVVRAQGVNGTISATAQVQTPITITKGSDLIFGNVFPGINKTVLVTDAGASQGGRFDVAGQASTAVTYYFALPTNLVNGGNNLPIGSWAAYRNQSASPSAGGLGFDPTTTTSGSPGAATLSGTGLLYFYLGATVTPPTNLPAGAYSGTITLTVSY